MGMGRVFLPQCVYLQMELVNSIPCSLRCFTLWLVFVCAVAFLYMHLLHSLFSYALDYISTYYPLGFGAFRYEFWSWSWWECTLTSPGWFLLHEIPCMFLIWWSLCFMLKHKTSIRNFPDGNILVLPVLLLCIIQVLCWSHIHDYNSCKGIFVAWFLPLMKENLEHQRL